MPELPEVESFSRRLRPELVGRTFTDAQVFWPRTVATGADVLCRELPGRGIERVGRRGKFLVFELRGGAAVLLHLRMTGRLEVVPAGDVPGRFTRVAFGLDDGRVLCFDDARKFGRVYLVPDVELVTGALGPEPLDDGFTVQAFARSLAQRARRLKPLLLDQTFLAGLGNIYVDESLHLAGLHPLRRADTLAAAEVARQHPAIRKTLNAAIERNGTSIDWAYPGGGYQLRLRVYDRAGLPCRRCGTLIERTVVGQRGTYYCPRCQRAESEEVRGKHD